MPRVMMVGAGPLPRSDSKTLYPGALRTRQLLDALQQAGLTVNLYTIPVAVFPSPESAVTAMLPDNFEGLACQRFTTLDSEFAIRALGEQARQLQPDALLGVGTYPGYLAAMIPGTLPLWADFHTHTMSEAQGRGFVEASDARLPDAWSLERALVRRLDKYSAISRPLLHALLAELASCGRFNQFTNHYQFGHHLPISAWRWPHTKGAAPGPGANGPILRGPIVPTDAFVVLWSGPFEGWSDPAGLVEAMNLLMEHQPHVHCVITGAKMEGVARPPQQLLEELIERSLAVERFHLLGAVGTAELEQIYREADVGVVLDRRNYETLFGTHWRIAAMTAERLAVAFTVGTELTEWLDDVGAGMGVPIGNPAALAEAIEPWIDQREHLHTLGHRAHKFMHEHCAPTEVAAKLVSWLREPKLAPDNHAKLELDGQVVTDLNAVFMNGLEEQTQMLMRYRVAEMQQALADWELRHQRAKTKFSFGLRRT